jgi:membrane-bound inhibitor of C-type lysozyme
MTYDDVSGLANAVQGNRVCPQQQDVDTCSGTGNFTHEDCQGYTCQNISIQVKNINANSSTIVSFGNNLKEVVKREGLGSPTR